MSRGSGLLPYFIRWCSIAPFCILEGLYLFRSFKMEGFLFWDYSVLYLGAELVSYLTALDSRSVFFFKGGRLVPYFKVLS